MVMERIKKVEGKQKAYCVYIPESYMKHCGWDANEVIALYPNEDGDKIEIVSMDPAKHTKKSESEDDYCSYC